MKKRISPFSISLIILFGLIILSPAWAYQDNYQNFLSGRESLGFEPGARFNNEVYWYIKNKYPGEVSNSTIFSGSKTELKRLLKAASQDTSALDAMTADSHILKTFIDTYQGKVPRGLAIYACAVGMVKSLKDPECDIILPSQSKDPRRDMIPEGYGGIGVLIEERNGEVIIIHPFKDGPGKQAGLGHGDRILAVDGQSVKNIDLDTVLNKLRGKVGSTVKLKLKRNGNVIEKTVPRQDITLNPVYAGIASNGVGFVKIVYFGENYPAATYEAINKFQERGIKNWVLDLRDNAGGALNNFIIASSMFVPPKQPIMFIQYKDKEKKFESVAKRNVLAPSAVIVNEYTTGSAEALAEVLREYKGVRIYGQTTMGNSAVSEFFKLSGGATLKLTVGEMVTGKRNKLHKQGVKPDVVIPNANEPANFLPVLNKVVKTVK
ncbi:MAG: S41 family peptidase [Vulcanimicrobiota bacterium]